jgi:hypothetical protein
MDSISPDAPKIEELSDWLDNLSCDVKIIKTDGQITDIQIGPDTFVRQQSAGQSSGWFFRPIEVEINLTNVQTTACLTRCRQLGYKIFRPKDSLGRERKDAFQVVKSPGDYLLIEAGGSLDARIIEVQDNNQCENSPFELAIKLATTFKGTIRGILVARDNYQDLGMYPVIIVNGRQQDITAFKVDLIPQG